MESSWLPPLNSHDNFNTTFKVSHRQTPSSSEVANKRVCQLSVRVTFCSEDEDIKETIDGLCIDHNFTIVASISSEELRTRVSSLLKNRTIIPFQLENLSYFEDDPSKDATTFQKEDELIDRVVAFFENLKKKPTLKDDLSKFLVFYTIQVDLELKKEVVVPKVEFGEWRSWYREQNESRPLVFEEKYMEAISKPRPEKTWFVKVDDDKIKTCALCLEDLPFFYEMSKALLLPCGHEFHDECIVKWLNIKSTCPMCRAPAYSFDTSSSDED